MQAYYEFKCASEWGAYGDAETDSEGPDGLRLVHRATCCLSMLKWLNIQIFTVIHSADDLNRCSKLTKFSAFFNSAINKGGR
jgi:hypothetical protein